MRSSSKKKSKKQLIQLDKLNALLQSMGYSTTVDTRMGLKRVHVWDIVEEITCEKIQEALRDKLVTVTKHKELGVWVYADERD